MSTVCPKRILIDRNLHIRVMLRPSAVADSHLTFACLCSSSLWGARPLRGACRLRSAGHLCGSGCNHRPRRSPRAFRSRSAGSGRIVHYCGFCCFCGMSPLGGPGGLGSAGSYCGAGLLRNHCRSGCGLSTFCHWCTRRGACCLSCMCALGDCTGSLCRACSSGST